MNLRLKALLCISLVVLGIPSFAGEASSDRPDWGYTFIDAHYKPDNCPAELAEFHDLMIPMMEAGGHKESAYLRENSDALYRASKHVGGALDHDNADIRKHYNRAARELVRSCARLRELSFGAPSSQLYREMQKIEDTYTRIAALCDE